MTVSPRAEAHPHPDLGFDSGYIGFAEDGVRLRHFSLVPMIEGGEAACGTLLVSTKPAATAALRAWVNCATCHAIVDRLYRGRPE